MRDKYEPFESCKSVPGLNDRQAGVIAASNTVHTLWVAGAVQLIVGIACAYDTLKNNSSNIDRLIDGINDTLEDINDTLEQVNDNLERILDVLNDLPRLLHQTVTDSAVREALGKCESRMSIIQDKIRTPELFRFNIDTIDKHCDEIRVELGGIKGLAGVKGMLLAAPYFALWLPTRAAIEKERRRLNPTRPLESPWESTWTKKLQSVYHEVWELSINLDRHFEAVTIPKMPKNMVSLQIGKTGEFEDYTLEMPGPVRKDMYRLTCPGVFSPTEELQARIDVFPPDPGNPYRWVKVRSDTPAIAAHKMVQDNRKELVSFYSLMPDLEKMRAEVLGVFVEPAGFWAPLT